MSKIQVLNIFLNDRSIKPLTLIQISFLKSDNYRKAQQTFVSNSLVPPKDSPTFRVLKPKIYSTLKLGSKGSTETCKIST